MHFEVKAVRAGTDVIAMTFDAADVKDAAGQAQAQGYDVLSVKARQRWLRWPQTSGARFSLMLFSQELRALLDAGLTQVEALATMVEKERHPHNRNILQRIIDKSVRRASTVVCAAAVSRNISAALHRHHPRQREDRRPGRIARTLHRLPVAHGRGAQEDRQRLDLSHAAAGGRRVW